MQEDSTVVVASYLVVGLTEEDVYYTRKHLEAYATLFMEDEKDVDKYSIDMINDSIYPCMVLKVDAVLWERFARTHDAVECSAVMSQNNILGEIH